MTLLAVSLWLTGTSGVSPPASVWGDGPAPDGFHWEFVFDDLGRAVRAAGGTINPDGEPVVALVED